LFAVQITATLLTVQVYQILHFCSTPHAAFRYLALRLQNRCKLQSSSRAPIPLTAKCCRTLAVPLRYLEGLDGGQDVKGFYLAVLTNMGLKEAVQNVPLSLLLEAIEEVALQNPKLNLDTKTGEAMLNRFNRGLEELKAFAGYLEEKS
jgi:hypothetical protein